jgi:hypothetical protein
LGDYLAQTAQASIVAEPGTIPAKEGVAKSVIHIFLPGGISSHEFLDPKPDAPAEYRGPFGTTKTKIEGEVFSELMRETAGIADKITVVRSLTHGEAAHERGTHNMFTGYRPSPAILFPSFGSIVSEEFGPSAFLLNPIPMPGQAISAQLMAPSASALTRPIAISACAI